MDDTKERIHDAIIVRLQNAINEHVDPAVQLEVDEGLGTIPHAGAGPLRGLQQFDDVASTIEVAVNEVISGLSPGANEVTPDTIEPLRRK